MKYKIIFCCPIESYSQIKYHASNIFYFGNKTISNSENILGLDIEDRYENLALKMLVGYSKIKDLNFDFLFKFDSDTFVNFDNIAKALDNLELDSNYGFLQEGNSFKKPILNKKPLIQNAIFPLGGGYILNKHTVYTASTQEYINQAKQQILENICTFEDVMVGSIIKKNNLKIKNSGYWINKAKGCYSSCFDVFYHSTKDISEENFKKINLYIKTA